MRFLHCYFHVFHLCVWPSRWAFYIYCNVAEFHFVESTYFTAWILWFCFHSSVSCNPSRNHCLVIFRSTLQSPNHFFCLCVLQFCNLRMSSLLSKLSLGTRDTIVLLVFLFFFQLLPWFFLASCLLTHLILIIVPLNVFTYTVMLKTSSWSAFMTAMVLLQKLHRDCLAANLLELVTFIFFSFGLSFSCSGSLRPTFWFYTEPSTGSSLVGWKMLKKNPGVTMPCMV